MTRFLWKFSITIQSPSTAYCGGTEIYVLDQTAHVSSVVNQSLLSVFHAPMWSGQENINQWNRISNHDWLFWYCFLRARGHGQWHQKDGHDENTRTLLSINWKLHYHILNGKLFFVFKKNFLPRWFGEFMLVWCFFKNHFHFGFHHLHCLKGARPLMTSHVEWRHTYLTHNK